MDFVNRKAVITGGGSGIGRALALRLAAAGCDVAVCDVSSENLARTADLIKKSAPRVKVVTGLADVSVEQELAEFRNVVEKEFASNSVNFLFNNAGIGGGTSFVKGDRAEWERTFNVCWNGVYYGTRVFLPMLINADAAHLVNVSSVNSFWASGGQDRPHTAYCSAKFAVRGFTEALITDLKVNAPHVKCSVVMPGQVATDIAGNTVKVLSVSGGAANAQSIRRFLEATGDNLETASDNQVIQKLQSYSDVYKSMVKLTADEAAAGILQGVEAGHWRILIGKDAEFLDQAVRSDPESAYTDDFFGKLLSGPGWIC